MVSEISRPVMPQDEALEYLTSQAVAEFLAHKVDPRLDGIIFHSSQTGGDGRNAVLFNHARGVESHSLPEGTSVEVRLPPRGLDDSDEWHAGIVVWETVPSNLPEVESAAPKGEERRGPIRILMEDEPNEVEEGEEPTLRLDINSVGVLAMQAVAYTTKELSVSRHRQTEEERDALNQSFTDIDMDSILDV